MTSKLQWNYSGLLQSSSKLLEVLGENDKTNIASTMSIKKRDITVSDQGNSRVLI